MQKSLIMNATSTPDSHFSINREAWWCFHYPAIRKPEEVSFYGLFVLLLGWLWVSHAGPDAEQDWRMKNKKPRETGLPRSHAETQSFFTLSNYDYFAISLER